LRGSHRIRQRLALAAQNFNLPQLRSLRLYASFLPSWSSFEKQYLRMDHFNGGTSLNGMVCPYYEAKEDWCISLVSGMND